MEIRARKCDTRSCFEEIVCWNIMSKVQEWVKCYESRTCISKEIIVCCLREIGGDVML